jgi:hypothetical protein
MIASSLDSASRWLNWSNVLYVGGAALTVTAAMYVLYEHRAIAAGKRVKFYVLSEIITVLAAIVSLVGTIGAIHFSNTVSHLKDVDLATYKTSADLKIAQANRDAADANNKAKEANAKAIEAENENLKLGGQVGQDATRARNAERALEAKNKETNDFAHAIAQQQQNMAEQAKVSPVLNAMQVDSLANVLKPFAGQSVAVHMTLDTVVIRLGNGIQAALLKGGLKPSGSMDAGQTYQGVSVVVHSPQDVPPLANALLMGLRQQGIGANPAAAQFVPAGQVAIYLGPN